MNNFIHHKKPFKYGVNIGSSSILVIFVVLCLVSFATLSIVSANADYKLSSKVLERSVSYYNACNQAEEAIASIDLTLHEVYSQVQNEEEYFSTVGTFKTYNIPISDLQTLEIVIDFIYPTSNRDTLYKIRSFQVITTGELNYDNTLPVSKD